MSDQNIHMADYLADVDFENVPDLVLLEDGEHELVIKHAEAKLSAKGRPMVSVRLESTEEPNADVIFEYLQLPDEQDDERAANNKKRRLRDFVYCFQIMNPADETAWVGCRGFVLTQIEAGRDGYPDRNRISKFLGAQA